MMPERAHPRPAQTNAPVPSRLLALQPKLSSGHRRGVVACAVLPPTTALAGWQTELFTSMHLNLRFFHKELSRE